MAIPDDAAPSNNDETKAAHHELERETAQLERILISLSGWSVARKVGVTISDVALGGIGASPLVSPARLGMHALGLLAQHDARHSHHVTPGEWDDLVRRLNRVHQLHMQRFPKLILEKRSDESKHIVDVVFGPFILAHAELPRYSSTQLRELIPRRFERFENDLADVLGTTPSELCQLADAIQIQFSHRAQEAVKLNDELNRGGPNFMQLLATAGTDEERRDFMQVHPVGRYFLRLKDLQRDLLVIDEQDVGRRFGDPARAQQLLSLFTLERGKAPAYRWLTDEDPLATRPLLRVEDGRLICPYWHGLLYAIIARFDEALRNSPARESYLRHRDRQHEDDVLADLGRIAPANAVILPRAREMPSGEFDHDIVILTKSEILIVEAKASVPRKPMRDPEKAYVKIKKDFLDKKGVQGGFDQAERLRQRILHEPSVDLYDAKGKVIATVSREGREVIALVITAENYASLSCDLTMLLKKEPDAPFPWAATVWDLESFVDALLYFKKGWKEFVDYLLKRRELHGRIRTADELEIAGIYLEDPDLLRIVEEAERRFGTPLHTLPTTSDKVSSVFLIESASPRRARPHSRHFFVEEALAGQQRGPR